MKYFKFYYCKTDLSIARQLKKRNQSRTVIMILTLLSTNLDQWNVSWVGWQFHQSFLFYILPQLNCFALFFSQFFSPYITSFLHSYHIISRTCFVNFISFSIPVFLILPLPLVSLLLSVFFISFLSFSFPSLLFLRSFIITSSLLASLPSLRPCVGKTQNYNKRGSSSASHGS